MFFAHPVIAHAALPVGWIVEAYTALMHMGGVPLLEHRPIRLSRGGTTRHIMRPRLTPTTGEAETCGMNLIDGGKHNGRECRAMVARLPVMAGAHRLTTRMVHERGR